MAITTGNSGSIEIGGVSECDITSWTATINRTLVEYTTMCLDGAAAYIDGTTEVTGTIESLEWLGDTANASLSLTNEVLNISGADAFFESIEIATNVGELNTFTYGFKISGPYVITLVV